MYHYVSCFLLSFILVDDLSNDPRPEGGSLTVRSRVIKWLPGLQPLSNHISTQTPSSDNSNDMPSRRLFSAQFCLSGCQTVIILVAAQIDK
jgi:hypothetical protein